MVEIEFKLILWEGLCLNICDGGWSDCWIGCMVIIILFLNLVFFLIVLCLV